MSNDQSLPRPNLPQPPSVGGDQGLTGSPLASGSLASGSVQPISSTTQLSTPLASAPQSASSKPLTQVSGLDPQSPGGPPPQLNEQGQVTNTSVISKTQQVPTFDQPVAPPESTLQKMQATGVAQTTQGKPGVGALGVSGQTAVGRNQVGEQAQPQANVASQQTIGFIQDTLPDAQGNIREADDLRNSSKLGVRLPGIPGSNSGAGSPLVKESEKSDSKKSSKTKQPKATGPKQAKPQNPIVKYAIFAVVALIIVGGVIFGITQILGGDKEAGSSSTATRPAGSGTGSSDQSDPSSSTTKTSSNVVLSYWGLWEPESVMREVFEDFKKETGISVDYRQQSHKDYRTRLQAAISEGSGPDVFRYHATWVPMLKDDLAVLPTNVMSVSEYEKTFYPIMTQQLQVNGQIVGIPLMYDGLGLYYNKDILQTANEQVPSTWGELRVLAEKLTVRDGTQVQRGGVALGNATNVEHFADILGLLIYQNGGDISNPVSGEVRDAIDFYVLFGKDKPVYGTNLPSSTAAFARGEVAMMLAPSWRVHEVLHLNPDLNFDIAPVPKLGASEFGWASYWSEGVSGNSQHKQEAWQLLSYLSSKEVLRKLYSAQSEIRAFGEIYPRQDMAQELASAKYVAAFLEDAKLAKSGPTCSFTHDAGLNDNIIQYFVDVINSASTKSLSDNDIQALGKGVNQVLSQY